MGLLHFYRLLCQGVPRCSLSLNEVSTKTGKINIVGFGSSVQGYFRLHLVQQKLAMFDFQLFECGATCFGFITAVV
jgi:hypothetical protein